jgi:transcriptional regulator with XRE-family HTH domain
MEKTLARRLRIERAARGLSLTEAAEKIGIRRDTLSELERGKRGAYSGTLEKIAAAYDLSLGELLSEETTLAGKAEAPSLTGHSEHTRQPRYLGPISAKEFTELLERIQADPATRGTYQLDELIQARIMTIIDDARQGKGTLEEELEELASAMKVLV